MTKFILLDVGNPLGILVAGLGVLVVIIIAFVFVTIGLVKICKTIYKAKNQNEMPGEAVANILGIDSNGEEDQQEETKE